jgi:hypothetical protein
VPGANDLSRLNIVASVIDLGAGLVDSLKTAADQFGSIQDEVTVTVWGGPNSVRSKLYHLAASIGFGLVQRLGPVSVDIPAPGSVTIQYDAADNYVTFHLRYSNTLAVILATTQLPGRPAAADLFERLPVLSGPEHETIGGEWNFTGPGVGGPLVALPGIPTPVLGMAGAGTAGHVLLTKNPTSPEPNPTAAPGANAPLPTLNPRPYADHRSRGSWTSLVYAALTTPGTTYDMTFASPPGTTADFRGK